jgi:hypothetical protein
MIIRDKADQGASRDWSANTPGLWVFARGKSERKLGCFARKLRGSDTKRACCLLFSTGRNLKLTHYRALDQVDAAYARYLMLSQQLPSGKGAIPQMATPRFLSL